VSIEYINVEKDISDQLLSIINTEFNPIEAVLEDKFQLQRLAERGEYIRVWPGSSDYVSHNSDGETRDYNYSVFHYFDTKRYRKRKDWDNLYSKRSARLRALMRNKHYHTTSEVSNLEMSSDSGDWMALPGNLFTLDSLDITFEAMTSSAAQEVLFCVTSSGLTKDIILVWNGGNTLEINHDKATLDSPNDSFTGLSQDVYYTIRLQATSSSVNVTLNGTTKTVTATSSLADYDRGWFWGHGGVAYNSQAGAKIKNMTGTLGFGTPYKEVTNSNIAVAADTVASIKNTGACGGYFTQPTAAREPTIVAVTNSTEYKWHNLTLLDSSPPIYIGEFEDIAEDLFDGVYGIVHNITITRSNFES